MKAAKEEKNEPASTVHTKIVGQTSKVNLAQNLKSQVHNYCKKTPKIQRSASQENQFQLLLCAQELATGGLNFPPLQIRAERLNSPSLQIPTKRLNSPPLQISAELDSLHLRLDGPRSIAGNGEIIKPPTLRYLASFKNLVLVDLENVSLLKNWNKRCLPPDSYVWGFRSGRVIYKKEESFINSKMYKQLKEENKVHVTVDIGFSKNAADFIMCVTIGELHLLLPKSITFFIVSNDGGFCEVDRQMEVSGRRVIVTAPRKVMIEGSLREDPNYIIKDKRLD